MIRLGAMGDILHALPAVASLKASFPAKKIVWLAAEKWTPLFEGNPSVDALIPFNREGLGSLLASRRQLRQLQPEIAIDFQGLLQSALAGWIARPKAFFGFDRSVAREPLACRFYTSRVHVTGPHRIERNLQLVRAAGASQLTHSAWIPPGAAEGKLPAEAFILASPFAGWNGKQWPLPMYDKLGAELRKRGLRLVANVPHQLRKEVEFFRHVQVETSSLSGLIYATRRAAAIVGVDSGPLHLAAALKKPGVALFGPTDPGQTGPFDSQMTVLRATDAETTYKRHRVVHPSMSSISVEQVAEALLRSIAPVRQPLTATVRGS